MNTPINSSSGEPNPSTSDLISNSSDVVNSNDSNEEQVGPISLWRLICTTPISDVVRGRLSGRLDAKGLISSSDLPFVVQNRILSIVKRTRLWRTEKVNVAGELIAHFGDGLESGATAEELLANFGDVKATAKLIRRAKRRCRPLLWHTIHRLSQASAALMTISVTTYLLATVFYASGRLNVAIDYRNEINQPALSVPDDERAWPIYLEALHDLDQGGFERWKLGTFALGMTTNDASWEQVVLALDANRGTLEKSRLAAAMPHLGRSPYLLGEQGKRELWFEPKFGEAELFVRSSNLNQSLGSMQMPHLLDLQKLSLLLSLDALHAAEKRDGNRAVADIEAVLGLAKQLQENRIAGEQFTALEAVHHALNATSEILKSHADSLSDAQLHQLAHDLANRDLLPAFDSKLTRAIVLDNVQRIYSDDGNGTGRLTPAGFKNMMLLQGEREWEDFDRRGVVALLPLVSPFVATRKKLTDELDRVLISYDAHARMPYWETLSRKSDFARWKESRIELRYHLRFMAMIDPTLHFDSMFLIHQTEVGRLDGIVVAIALEAFRRKYNGWPSSLAELSPEFLPRVPLDRFTGEPLRFRVVDGESIVYSVSHDLSDNDGVLPFVPGNIQLPRESQRNFLQRVNNLCAPHYTHTDETFAGDWILWQSKGWALEQATRDTLKE